jgi:predicted small lipoprotein YifL
MRRRLGELASLALFSLASCGEQGPASAWFVAPAPSDAAGGPDGVTSAEAAAADAPSEAARDARDSGGSEPPVDAAKDAGAPETSPPADSGPDPCAPIGGASYSATSVKPETSNPAKHGDINLLLRTWQPCGAKKGLVDVGGPTDSRAPKLYTLFADDRMPVFSAVFQVQSWDWGCACPGAFMTDPEVTMAGFAMAPGEVVQLPRSGYDIGGGYQALVLYAADDTITLKYTRDDNVVSGYTIHFARLCVEPSLRKLYDQCHAQGRTQLPQLRGDEPLGRARTSELLVTIRDTGSWMDPRVKKDWYQP